MAIVETGRSTAAHPLDPLSVEEIRRARELLHEAGLVGDTTRFPLVQLVEPPKELVLGFAPGDAIDRQVFVAFTEPTERTFTEAVVSVTQDRVVSTRQLDPDEVGQPPILAEEWEAVDAIVKADERWIEAMRRRGIMDLSQVRCCPLSAGSFDLPGEEGLRIMRVPVFFAHHPRDLAWAHPIEGVVAYVDLKRGTVFHVVDEDVLPIPEDEGNLDDIAVTGTPRTTLRSIEILQPEGPSFTVDGSAISWENWSFRIGFEPREGLVLHRISFRDGDRERPILYRASVAEMIVSYGDPGPAHFWKNYFDAGEYCMGQLANSLVLGCDCLGEIHYFDAVLADDRGEPRVLKNAICLHEEDYSVLWKHYNDIFSGSSETRRQRRLVLSWYTTVGNYDYGFYWHLYLDGTIQLEVKATGLLHTTGYRDGGHRWATEVAPGLAAPYHQHFFCARLDTMIDGTTNAVDEVDIERIAPGPGNEHGNAFSRKRTRLTNESGGGRLADPLNGRVWAIVNPDAGNRLGQPVGYALHPEGSPVLAADAESSIARRAAFATKHLWVTRYDEAERYPAGDYPNQHPGGAGLPAWITKQRPIDGEDIVVWHTFGLTHFPRTEEWPIMPVAPCGFTLKPVNFFDRNPTLDVPSNHAHCASDHDHRGAR